MRKVEIEFPGNFEDGGVLPISIGRLILGDSVCRLYFGPDGKMKMFCDAGAREFIKFAETQEVLGFGKAS